jgi:hypothetical protein
MNPPNVYDVTIPRSQRTHNTTKIVQSIVLFRSHKKSAFTALVPRLKTIFGSSRELILAAWKIDVCTLEHTLDYLPMACASELGASTSRARTTKRFGAGPT